MCKKTIETSLEVEGVASAAWDQNTKMISVAYDSTILNEEKLHKLIAGSGYDTEKETASTDTYNNLPECCQYKRKQEMN